jgi:uncharacterized protein YbjT (DUF2867 family)
MKVLVIGGTRFLGRHLVEALLARHHEITLFNRGRTAPGLFADVEEIHGDRELDLERLAGRRWDAVIDTCGYLPRVVRAACEALHGAVERYVFVSSISVYARFDAAQLDEDAPLAALDDPLVEDVAAHYGALKAACEREVQAAFGANALLVRPGLIVGPFDPTGRFTYWPQRLAAGGEILAPGQPGDPVQFIDVRDLAEWIVRALTRGPGGAYNATGPATPWHFRRVSFGLHQGAGGGAGADPDLVQRALPARPGRDTVDRDAAVGAGRRAGDPSGLDPARARYRAGVPAAGGHRDRHAGVGAVAAVRGAGRRLCERRAERQRARPNCWRPGMPSAGAKAARQHDVLWGVGDANAYSVGNLFQVASNAQ